MILIMETEISEMLVFKLPLARLITQEDFSTFILCESLKSYRISAYIISQCHEQFYKLTIHSLINPPFSYDLQQLYIFDPIQKILSYSIWFFFISGLSARDHNQFY
jgi:hypothetical protein